MKDEGVDVEVDATVLVQDFETQYVGFVGELEGAVGHVLSMSASTTRREN